MLAVKHPEHTREDYNYGKYGYPDVQKNFILTVTESLCSAQSLTLRSAKPAFHAKRGWCVIHGLL
jgi:hypothetical protein